MNDRPTDGGQATDRPVDALRAVLFDMDGVLVDSEPQWFAAETATAGWLGYAWTPADQHALLGTNLPFAADYMLEVSGARAGRQEVMDRLRDEMTEQLAAGVRILPGACELLAEVHAAGIPAGLVTSSVRRHVDAVLAQLPGVRFEVVVTGDDVERRKPDPQPYLLALQQLVVPADRTVVLEDSPLGVAAGEAAGCTVVAVPSVVAIPPAPGRTVVSSLTELDLAQLRRLVAPSTTC